MTDPRIAVMHRYVEEYTNGHNIFVAREIMHPEYRFTMGGTTLNLEAYLAMVEGALDHFTDLRLVVNEFVVGPERLAMAFTETASSPHHGRRAAWHGVSLYTFHPDGRLLAVIVQQDFWSRRKQLRGDAPEQVAGATDPSVWETPVRESDARAHDALRRALGNLGSAEVGYDNGDSLAVTPNRIDVVDTIVTGDRFAAAIDIAGPTVTNGDESDLPIQGDVVLAAAGIGTITNGTITN
ncbi:MAG: nuclear transport factor 2 family protein, partial [bacterium]|nr:nuclear transport factor 2 family protein [bacterium]